MQLGAPPSNAPHLGYGELQPARAAVAVESRAAGLEPPVDTVFIHIGERYRDALINASELPRAMGFQGKLCIHPEQIAPVNKVFTPDRESVEHAQRVVAAFEEAEAAGSASIQVDGYFAVSYTHLTLPTIYSV